MRRLIKDERLAQEAEEIHKALETQHAEVSKRCQVLFLIPKDRTFANMTQFTRLKIRKVMNNSTINMTHLQMKMAS